VSTDNGGEGVYNAGPSTRFCEGLVTAGGRGVVACSTDADCSIFGPGVGPCSPTGVNRSCFPNPIVAIGSPGTERAQWASTFCAPPFTAASLNFGFGFPGPGA
jgi:hypothetical protein